MQPIGITQLTVQGRSSGPTGQGTGSVARTLQRIFRKCTHVVQCDMIAGFASRTYTPMDWDTGKGRTRLLGCVHGSDPAMEVQSRMAQQSIQGNP